MKKLLSIALVLFVASCTNPEDRATGDADSTSFNSNTENNLNTQSNLDNGPGTMPDSSSIPSTNQENSNSATGGTNRAYGSGRDTGRQ